MLYVVMFFGDYKVEIYYDIGIYHRASLGMFWGLLVHVGRLVYSKRRPVAIRG